MRKEIFGLFASLTQPRTLWASRVIAVEQANHRSLLMEFSTKTNCHRSRRPVWWASFKIVFRSVGDTWDLGLYRVKELDWVHVCVCEYFVWVTNGEKIRQISIKKMHRHIDGYARWNMVRMGREREKFFTANLILVENYLENTFEKTLWLESLVVGAESVSGLPGSPVRPSTHDSGYDKRLSIWNDSISWLWNFDLNSVNSLCSSWLHQFPSQHQFDFRCRRRWS